MELHSYKEIDNILENVKKAVIGINNSDINDFEDYMDSGVAIAVYKLPGEEKSKQLICGSQMLILTVICSMLQNLYAERVIDRTDIKSISELVLNQIKEEEIIWD